MNENYFYGPGAGKPIKRNSIVEAIVWVIVFVLVGAFVLLYVADMVGNLSKKEELKEGQKEILKEELTYGNKFTISGFNFAIGKKVKFTKVDNMFSEYHDKSVIKFPILIKNVSGESQGLTFNVTYTIYKPDGTEANLLYYYFDDDLKDAGNMRSLAQYDGYIYVLYEGDGDYYAEFSKWLSDDVIEIKLPVKK